MERRRFQSVLILLAAILSTGSSSALQAATYYVSPDGDDTAPGSPQRPWRSPAFGAGRLRPGDTLVLKAGTYVLSDYETDILRPPSGTPSAWITIRGEENGAVTLAGRDDLAMAVELGGTRYVRLEDLEITHDHAATGASIRFRDGISITEAPAAHIVLNRLSIHSLDEFGINAGDVEDLRILDSRIEYCGFGAFGGPAGEQGGLRDLVIRGCSLSWSGHYYRGGDGANRPYDRPDGFGIEPSDGPITIEDTTAEHNFGDGLDSKARNTTIRRCVVANNSCDGVKLWGGGSRVENTVIYGRGDGDPETTPWAAVVIGTNEAGADFKLFNLSIDDRLGGNYLVYAQYDDPVPITVTIRNCIFSGLGSDCPLWFRDTVTLEADHDLFWLPGNDEILIHGSTSFSADDIASLGTGNLSGDPLFEDPAWGSEGDYHLQNGSPAIDAGTMDDAPAEDLDGTVRDDHPDIGAYEFGGSSFSHRLLVPAVAHNPGAGNTLWRTDLAVVNTDPSPLDLRLELRTDGTAYHRTTSIPGGGTRVWRNVVESLFGLDISETLQGVVIIDAAAPVAVAARTFNQTSDGTYGQFVPALRPGDGIETGATGMLPLVSKGPSSRTNVGLFNPGTGEVTARIRLFGPDGSQLGNEIIRSLEGGCWIQVDDIFSAADANASEEAFSTIDVLSAAGEVWAYASVIDTNTGDAVTVPLTVP